MVPPIVVFDAGSSKEEEGKNCFEGKEAHANEARPDLPRDYAPAEEPRWIIV